MNPTDMAVFVQDMGELISTLNALGLPGLLAIVLSGPAVVVCLIVYLNINSSIRMEELILFISISTLPCVWKKCWSHTARTRRKFC